MVLNTMGIAHPEQNRLIISHMHMVEPLAAPFRGRKGIPFEDLVACGRRGLTIAAHEWEPHGKFLNYAQERIVGHIRNFIADWDHLIPLDAASDEDKFELDFCEWD